jgi:hypothetical protein
VLKMLMGTLRTPLSSEGRLWLLSSAVRWAGAGVDTCDLGEQFLGEWFLGLCEE